jgi:hypothetical protein
MSSEHRRKSSFEARKGSHLRMTYSALRRRLLFWLIDRDVLAMRQWRVAVGDDKRVEFDEAVALLVVIAGARARAVSSSPILAAESSCILVPT